MGCQENIQESQYGLPSNNQVCQSIKLTGRSYMYLKRAGES